MKLYALRHAPVIERHLCYGRHDLEAPLSERQAGQLLADWPRQPDWVVTSPAARCRAVAGHLSRAWGLPARLEHRVHELDFGLWEGRPWQELENEPEFRAWMANWQLARPPGGESLADLQVRVTAWLEEVRQQPGEGCGCVVTHAGVVRCLRVLLGGLTWEQAMRAPVAHLEPLAFELS